ncbi:MAG TPA: cytochrome P450 [Chloroflexia bacterium]|jgi:cytochrome P450
MRATSVNVPPGPRGNFVLGNVLQVKKDPLDFLAWCGQQYGDIIRLRLVNRSGYLINNPHYIEQVLVTNAENFIKPPGREPSGTSELLFGEQFMSSDGDFWMRHRRTVQPALHHRRINQYADVMVDYTQRMLSTWTPGETRDVYQDLMRLTLEVIARTLFSADAGGDVQKIAAGLDVIMREITSRMVNPFQVPMRIPTRRNVRFKDAVTQLNDFMNRVVAEHADGHAPDDMLSMLLEGRAEDSKSLTEMQWQYEVMTLFIAGYETTALALTWSLYLLSQYPTAAARLQEEVRAVLGDSPPTAADYSRLEYTGQVIKETLRLYPPVWFLGARIALQTCHLGPYEVPAGAMVLISPWVTHRDPRNFDRPLEFDPGRWSGEASKQQPKYAYFPFGGGPRHCIGYSYAVMEAVMMLATIVQTHRLTHVAGHPVEPEPLITLRPRYGMQMVVSPADRG